jgi:hypothetical protein
MFQMVHQIVAAAKPMEQRFIRFEYDGDQRIGRILAGSPTQEVLFQNLPPGS